MQPYQEVKKQVQYFLALGQTEEALKLLAKTELGVFDKDYTMLKSRFRRAWCFSPCVVFFHHAHKEAITSMPEKSCNQEKI